MAVSAQTQLADSLTESQSGISARANVSVSTLANESYVRGAK